MQPYRACCSSVASYHAAVTPVLHHDEAANQNEQRHGSTYDEVTSRWEQLFSKDFLALIILFFKGFNVSDFKVKTTQKLIINLFEVKDHPVNSFTAVIYYIIVREKNTFGPNGIFLGCNTSSGHWGRCGGWSGIKKKPPAKWKQEV